MKWAIVVAAAVCLVGCASAQPQPIVFTDSVVGYICTDRDGNVTRYLPNTTINYGTIYHCNNHVCGGASWTCSEVNE